MNRIIYMTFLLGIIIWQYPIIYQVVNQVKCRFILRQNLKEITNWEEERKYKGLLLQMDRLLTATKLNGKIKKPEDLIIISFISGIGCGVCIFSVGGLKLGLLSGGFMMLLPSVLIMIKLNIKRIGGSKEGNIMIQELLANYKIMDCNMKEALQATYENLESAPHSKTLLMDVVNGLNNAYSSEEIEGVLDNFKFSLNTAWGNALASDIYFSEVYGVKVTDSLEDLASSITKSSEVIEYSHRAHNEARLMLKYLAPISYALSVGCACKFFGFSLSKFVKYQFGTALGLQWFIIMTLIYGTSIILNSWLVNEKMDI